MAVLRGEELDYCAPASFPTRRSSDLRNRFAAPGRGLPGSQECGQQAGNNDGSRSGRSEEHTSELQSRQYLVCRLLLEKKTRMVPVGCCAESGAVQVNARSAHMK